MINLKTLYLNTINNQGKINYTQLQQFIEKYLMNECNKQASRGWFSCVINLTDLAQVLKASPFEKPNASDIYHMQQLVMSYINRISVLPFPHPDANGNSGVKLTCRTLDLNHLLVTWFAVKN